MATGRPFSANQVRAVNFRCTFDNFTDVEDPQVCFNNVLCANNVVITGDEDTGKSHQNFAHVTNLYHPSSQPVLLAQFPSDSRTTTETGPPVPPITETSPMTPEATRAAITARVATAAQHLSPQQAQQLQVMLGPFAHAFTGRLGQVSDLFHSIDTGRSRPARRPMYSYTPAQHAEINRQIQKLLDTGCIRPSSSPWASSVVLVKKKDGTQRFTVDFRGLNTKTKTDVYPLPRIDDTLAVLGKAKYFTTLDLQSGYWQLTMTPEDSEKTAFQSQHGLWEWIRMPMGLKNAGSSFQRMMDFILGPLSGTIALVYLDDIIIFSASFDQHLRDIRAVLQKLTSANLTFKLAKCFFAMLSVEFLGHLISANGIAPHPRLVSKVKHCSPPTSVTEVRSFLGLTGYYRYMIPNYSALANPIIALTHKGTEFSWSPECQAGFDALTTLLTSEPIMHHPDFDKTFTLHCDASEVALGIVLTQTDDSNQEHPVRYISRLLNRAERNYSPGERECLAVVYGIRQCRRYINGTKFIVITDHKPLLALLRTPLDHHNPRWTRWALELQQYDFEFKHRAGTAHGNADALSRPPIALTPDNPPSSVSVNIASTTNNSLVTDIISSQARDTELSQIFALIRHGTSPQDPQLARYLTARLDSFIIDDDTLYFFPTTSNERTLVVGIAHRDAVMRLFHECALGGGHRSADITYHKLRKRFWWPNAFAQVKSWVRSCPACQAHSRKPADKHLIYTRITPSFPFQHVFVDTISLPTSSADTGKCQIAFVVIDHLTRAVEIHPNKQATALNFVEWFISHIITTHGCPETITSDRGSEYVNTLMTQMTKTLKLKHKMVTAYKPRANGMVERVNGTIKTMIRKYSDTYNMADWPLWLPFIKFAYNNTPHSATGFTPFYLLHGREARLPVDVDLSVFIEHSGLPVDQFAHRLRHTITEARSLARDYLDNSEQMKTWASPHTPTQVSARHHINDLVFLHTNHPQPGLHSIHKRTVTGPFTIIRTLPPDTYVILRDGHEDVVSGDRLSHYNHDLPTSHITPEPPESLENPVTGPVDTSRTLTKVPSTLVPEPDSQSPCLTTTNTCEDSEDILPDDVFEVEAILDRRVQRRRSRTAPRTIMYLVKWRGYDSSHNSWEPERNLSGCQELVHAFLQTHPPRD